MVPLPALYFDNVVYPLQRHKIKKRKADRGAGRACLAGHVTTPGCWPNHDIGMSFVLAPQRLSLSLYGLSLSPHWQLTPKRNTRAERLRVGCPRKGPSLTFPTTNRSHSFSCFRTRKYDYYYSGVAKQPPSIQQLYSDRGPKRDGDAGSSELPQQESREEARCFWHPLLVQDGDHQLRFRRTATKTTTATGSMQTRHTGFH